MIVMFTADTVLLLNGIVPAKHRGLGTQKCSIEMSNGVGEDETFFFSSRFFLLL